MSPLKIVLSCCLAYNYFLWNFQFQLWLLKPKPFIFHSRSKETQWETFLHFLFHLYMHRIHSFLFWNFILLLSYQKSNRIKFRNWDAIELGFHGAVSVSVVLLLFENVWLFLWFFFLNFFFLNVLNSSWKGKKNC